MRMTTRFIASLLAVLAVVAVALSPLIGGLISRWFQRDIEIRSGLVFHTLEAPLAERLGRHDADGIRTLFDDVDRDERVAGVGWCDARNVLVHRSRRMPDGFSCRFAPATTGEPVFRSETSFGRQLLVGAFPLAGGRLVIVHDIGYITDRSASAQGYLVVSLIVLAALISMVTVLVARLTLRDWLRTVRDSFAQPVASAAKPSSADLAPLVDEIRQRLRALDGVRRSVDDFRLNWAPETLAAILDRELPDSEVIVVSNREPYIHNLVDGRIDLQIPASGLVSALEPVIRACSGTWIAHGSGSADNLSVDAHDHIAVPPDAPAYTLRRVWLSEAEQDGYYYGLANEGLWPLCHIAFVRPVFRDGDWQQYVAVNRKFADAVIAEARTPRPIVLVQDYHFALLPRMVRERLPEATIVTFWHIPWPNAESFSICPWRGEILRGLLGSSILGFHTQFHCNNFLSAVDRFLESRIDQEEATVTHGGETTLVRHYPISIEWPPQAIRSLPPAAICRAQVQERLGIGADVRLGVGVERFDYTKGILDRFLAVEALLVNHPEWVGRFSFLQIAAPTRNRLPVYQQLRAEAEALAERINARYGRPNWRPIVLLAEHHSPVEVFRLFRAADVCVVSSLHDGMNLVAKEFVAARDDERGVLVLSTFAGASRELLEALIVNPYDTAGMARALVAGLSMSGAEQGERMRLMREIVKENNVYRWAGRMLLDAARIRKRGHLLGWMETMN